MREGHDFLFLRFARFGESLLGGVQFRAFRIQLLGLRFQLFALAVKLVGHLFSLMHDLVVRDFQLGFV